MKVFSRIPLDISRVHIPRGQVCLIPNRCKGCGLCIEFCPQHVLCLSEQRNAKGYHFPSIALGKEVACVHCEFCTLVCPEFAIFTLPSNEASDEQ
jgi:2-oxoglutarate ferredoxin oxidoreductase subunit delta